MQLEEHLSASFGTYCRFEDLILQFCYPIVFSFYLVSMCSPDVWFRKLSEAYLITFVPLIAYTYEKVRSKTISKHSTD